MSDEGIGWAEELHEMLNSSASDKEIVEFVEENVPEDEGRIFDYKKEMYISADDDEEDNERKGKLVKLCNALSNVRADSQYRYIFIGFTESGFEGVDYFGDGGGDHLIDVDDADVQNLLQDYLNPSPEIERHKFSVSGDEGCIFTIERERNRPMLIDQSVRISDGKKTVVYEGQAYTRKGSRNTLMNNSEYRELIERRKEIMGEILEDFATDLSRVVSLPTEQLEKLDLSVSSSEEGVPVREIVTTEAAMDVDEKLKTAVKNWNSTGGRDNKGELISNRKTIYRFYDERDGLELTDEKVEFLFRSCLKNHQVGGEWLMRYEGNFEPLFESIIEEQRSSATICNIEKVLLSLGNEELLRMIADDEDIDYQRSRAEEYANKADGAPKRRIKEYCDDQVRLLGKHYRVNDFFDGSENPDVVLDEIIDEVLSGRDSSTHRTALREIEMVRLAKEAEDE